MFHEDRDGCTRTSKPSSFKNKSTKFSRFTKLARQIYIRLIMKENLSKNFLRQFGIFMGFSFPIIIGYLIPAIFRHSFREWTLFPGLIFILLAIINPRLLNYPYKFWISLGNILGWINSRIILGMIYILLLIPISLIMRLFGHDPLKNSFSIRNTYRENNEKKKIDLTQIF